MSMLMPIFTIVDIFSLADVSPMRMRTLFCAAGMRGGA